MGIKHKLSYTSIDMSVVSISTGEIEMAVKKSELYRVRICQVLNCDIGHIVEVVKLDAVTVEK